MEFFKGIDVRKLQLLGRQYFLNIPKNLIKFYNWEKGDYISVKQMAKDTLQIKKVAGRNTPKNKAVIKPLEETIKDVFSELLNNADIMNPGDFVSALNELSHLFGQLRKYKVRGFNRITQ